MYGSFWATMAELSSCNRDHMSCKPKYLMSSSSKKKSLQIPSLNYVQISSYYGGVPSQLRHVLKDVKELCLTWLGLIKNSSLALRDNSRGVESVGTAQAFIELPKMKIFL